MQSEEFEATYNVKDLILYALAIGFGSTNHGDTEDQLQYLYERHPRFLPVPTFCLALQFWAGRGGGNSSTSGLPSFPPPAMMSKNGIIHPTYLKSNVNISRCPLIHTWQSIVWHRRLPTPPISLESNSGRVDQVVRTKLYVKTVSITPKDVGAFVTTETSVILCEGASKMTLVGAQKQPSPICTMQSTALVLGAPKDQIIPYNPFSNKASFESLSQIPKDVAPKLEMTYKVMPNQALLYRLASGDTNRIHVDTSAAKMLGKDKKAPLLHGLCTLGIVYRALSRLINANLGETIRTLEGRFAQPVFVNDVLCTRIWEDSGFQQTGDGRIKSKRYLFVVSNKDSGVTVVDSGVAVIGCSDSVDPDCRVATRSSL